MTKEVKTLLAKLRRHQKAITKERDQMRDTVADFEDVIEGCDRAEENIQAAIDALSELQ